MILGDDDQFGADMDLAEPRVGNRSYGRVANAQAFTDGQKHADGGEDLRALYQGVSLKAYDAGYTQMSSCHE